MRDINAGTDGTFPIFQNLEIGVGPVCPQIFLSRSPATYGTGGRRRRSIPQALKRSLIFNCLTARMNSCPSRSPVAYGRSDNRRLELLEPGLCESHATVVIPLDDRILF